MISNETLGNSMSFRLDIRKRLFPQRVVRHWNKLLRAVVIAPRLPEFKECLDNTLRHFVGNW